MNEATILKPLELVDRYLGAVGALLPAGQRSEVLAEVRDVLLSRMDERQTQLGHPLSTQEAEEVLNGYEGGLEPREGRRHAGTRSVPAAGRGPSVRPRGSHDGDEPLGAS